MKGGMSRGYVPDVCPGVGVGVQGVCVCPGGVQRGLSQGGAIDPEADTT